MPGLIERYNGLRVVSLTANLHGTTLGEAVPDLNKAIANAGPPPRGVSVQFRGQIPPLENTILGLRVGLLLAIAIIVILIFALNVAVITLAKPLSDVISRAPEIEFKPFRRSPQSRTNSAFRTLARYI